MNNVIDFERARARLRGPSEHEVLDTHDAVLDLSDVVLTADHFDYDVTVTDDLIIISMGDEEEN
jgi:hypothetical protein